MIRVMVFVSLLLSYSVAHAYTQQEKVKIALDAVETTASGCPSWKNARFACGKGIDRYKDGWESAPLTFYANIGKAYVASCVDEAIGVRVAAIRPLIGGSDGEIAARALERIKTKCIAWDIDVGGATREGYEEGCVDALVETAADIVRNSK